MPSNEHRTLTDFCRKLFPDIADDHRQRATRGRGNRDKSIPDFLSVDGKIAVECDAFTESKLKQLQRYNNEYNNIILVFPLLDKVDVIIMYGKGKMRVFEEVDCPISVDETIESTIRGRDYICRVKSCVHWWNKANRCGLTYIHLSSSGACNDYLLKDGVLYTFKEKE